MKNVEPGTGAASLLPGWRYRAAIWSTLLAALAYLGLSVWAGRTGVSGALGQIGVAGMAVALGLSLVNYLLRFIRWQLYLGAMGNPIPPRPSLLIYFAGFALTTTPAKAGEMLRGLLLKPRGVSYTTSLAALLSERMSDVLAILALSLLGLAAYPNARTLVGIGAVCIGAILIVISNHRLAGTMHSAIKGAGRIPQLLLRLVEMLRHASSCHAPRLLLLATSLSLAAWAAEALAFHLILDRMHAGIGVALAMSVYAISMLAGAVSFMPGGLGGAEAAMIALLMAAGVDMTKAISATLVIRLATLWFAVALGLVALACLSRNRRAVSEEALL